MRAIAIVPIIATVIAGACGGNNDNCANGWTKTCLSDGTTCTCAPPCGQTNASCGQYDLCGANESCMRCLGPKLTGHNSTTTCRPDPAAGCTSTPGWSGWSCSGSDSPSDDPSNMVSCSLGNSAQGRTYYCCSATEAESYACTCANGLCVPSSWVPGQSVTFRVATSADGGGQPATGPAFDAAVGAPNK
jgi:hypothetical protein